MQAVYIKRGAGANYLVVYTYRMSLNTSSGWGKHMFNEKIKGADKLPFTNYLAQAAVAEYAYLHRPEDEVKDEPPPARITGNVIMGWWTRKDLGTAYGQYADSHQDALLDLTKETEIAQVVKEIRGNATSLH